MRNYLKALGPAVMAALAISAVGASTASAEGEGMLTSDGPVTLTGTENLEGLNALTSFGDSVKCPESTYTGHAVKNHQETTETEEDPEKLKHEFLQSGETEITVTPHYKQKTAGGKSNCRTGNEGRPMTITTNGCDFVFADATTTDGANTYGVRTSVHCPPKQAIEVHVYLGEAHGTSLCTLKVTDEAGGEQTKTNQDLTGFHLTNDTAKDDLDLTGTVSGIHVTRSGLCGSGTDTEGTFHADVTIEGHNEAGDPTGVTITHNRA